MDSSIKEEKGLKRKIDFTIPSQEVDRCFSKNYLKIQKTAKMPGFRQGKIPLKTIKQNYKHQAQESVLDELFKIFYPQVVKEKDIKPAGPPKLLNLDLQEGKACSFSLEIEVHPQVQVENYKNIELKKQKILIQEKEVTEALEKLKQSFAQFEDLKTTSPTKKGDCITLKLEGFSKIKKEKKLNYKSLLIEIGKEIIAPGFDEKLIGLRPNQEKEFDFIFPKNHPNPEIAGLDFHIKIKVTGFKQKTLPELNEEFAKKFKLANINLLKEKIKKDLEKNMEQKVKESMENSLIKQLIEKNPVELPEALIEEQKQKLKKNTVKRLEEYKMPLKEQESFLKDKDSIFEKEAKDSLHISYIMEQLIQDLKITVSEEDIKNSLKESFPTKKTEEMEKELKSNNYWNNFLFNLTRQKLISYLIKQSKITLTN